MDRENDWQLHFNRTECKVLRMYKNNQNGDYTMQEGETIRDKRFVFFLYTLARLV